MYDAIIEAVAGNRCCFFNLNIAQVADNERASDRQLMLLFSFLHGGVLLSATIQKKEKTVTDFYRSIKWKHKREAILRRDNYLCQNCKRYGRYVEAITVHHIKHYDEFPELALDNNNLVSLCNACHNKAHPEKPKSNRY